MNKHDLTKPNKKKDTDVKTFPVPSYLEDIKEEGIISINTISNDSKEQIINHAFKFHLQGNIQKATKYYQYCIKQGFNNYKVFCNYGIILRSFGKLKEAEHSQRKAIRLNPNYAKAHSNLGNVLKDLGNLTEAEYSQRKAIELNPKFTIAYLNLGNTLKELGKLQEAELFTQKAIELNPSLAEAHLNMGVILKDLGKIKEAQLSTRKAIELKSDFADAYFNLFQHYEQINNLKKLKESLKEFSQVKSIKNELILFRARLSFRNKEIKTAHKLINSVSNQWIKESNNIKKILYWSYKGFIEEKVRNYDIAYFCFEKSQEDSSFINFRRNIFFDYINCYKKSIIEKQKRVNNFNDDIKDSNLVFLVGFPRSGTTLLDTVLRSHPDIEVMEEKPIISKLEEIIKEEFNTKLDNIYTISKNNIMILRKKYFELASTYTNKKTKLIIDKLPLNTITLPLINLLFPNAKIIFAHRHPYDTVLSCFQQSFKPNSAMANLVSLKSSSKMYDQVMDAWDIYQTNIPLNFITSKYEHLVKDFEQHTLKILKFLDVSWDENIKNYRKTAIDRNKINTPSSSQVIEPLYKSSIEKWKNYKKYFEDCHQYLDKWVCYFDY